MRSSCSQRVMERYDAMKELFQSRIKGISEQLESTLSDLQKSLSLGSKRMQELDAGIYKNQERIAEETKAIHKRIDELYERVNIRITDLQTQVQKSKRPNWQFWGIAAMFIIAIGGEMLFSWKQIGVLEERLRNVITEVTSYKEDDKAELKELQEEIDKIQEKLHSRNGVDY